MAIKAIKNTENDIGKVKKDDSIIILCGHGSALKATEDEFAVFASKAAEFARPLNLEYAFLEFNRPTIGEKLREAYSRGYRRFACVPVMLLDGDHVRADIPGILGDFLGENPDAEGAVAAEFGLDRRVLDLAATRAETALVKGRLKAG